MSQRIVNRKPIKQSDSMDSLPVSSSFSQVSKVSAESKVVHGQSLLMGNETQMEELLEQMLTEMGIEDRQAIRSLPKDSKYLMLSQHFATPTQAQAQVMEDESPEYFVQQLKAKLRRQIISKFMTNILNGNQFQRMLISLKVSIQTQPLSWLARFVNLGGVVELFAMLHQDQCNLDLLRCIKAIANNQKGLDAILKFEYVQLLVKLACSDNLHICKLALDLLTVIAYTKRSYEGNAFNGVGMLLKCFNNDFSRVIGLAMEALKTKKELIAGVGWYNETKVVEKELVDFMVSVMFLLNGLLCNIQEVDYRVHVRNLFYRSGFLQLRNDLEYVSMSNEVLVRQLDQFEQQKKSDWSLYISKFKGLKAADKNPVRVIKALINKLNGSQGLMHLESLAQHLLMIRNDPEVMSGYIKLIDIVVAQIVLDGQGIDPDFSSLYNINVQTIVNEFIGAEQFARLKTELNMGQRVIDQLLEDKAADFKLIEQLQGAGSSEVANQQLQAHLQQLQQLVDLIPSGSNSQFKAAAPPRSSSLPNLMDLRGMQTNVPHQSNHVGVKGIQGQTPVALSTVQENNDVVEEPQAPPQPLDIDGSIVINNVPAAPLFMQKPPKSVLYQPKTKLKQLQWQKIPDHEIDQTLWKDMADEQSYVELLEQNGLFAYLETEFAQIVSQKKAKSEVEVAHNLSSMFKDISVIDPKKAYNLQILLSRLKVGTMELLGALWRMDEEALNPHLISQLIAFSPTPEEIGKLSQFRNSLLQNLAQVDSFLLDLTSVDNFDLRLKLMSLRNTFAERFKDIAVATTIVSQSLECIKDNQSFAKFLQLVLIVGNVMNGKNFRGSAYGFKVSSLLSLIDTTSVSRESWTLLHTIIKLAKDQFPEALEYVDQLDAIHQAYKVSVPQLALDFLALENEVSQLQHAIQQIDSHNQDSDVSPELSLASQIPFITRCSQKVQAHQDIIENMQEQVTQTLRLFGEDPKETTWEGITRCLSTFLTVCKRVLGEVDVVYETPKKAIQNEVKDVRQDSPEKGLMDSLLESLKHGTLKNTEQFDSSIEVRRFNTQERRNISLSYVGNQATDMLAKLNEF